MSLSQHNLESIPDLPVVLYWFKKHHKIIWYHIKFVLEDLLQTDVARLFAWKMLPHHDVYKSWSVRWLLTLDFQDSYWISNLPSSLFKVALMRCQTPSESKLLSYRNILQKTKSRHILFLKEIQMKDTIDIR